MRGPPPHGEHDHPQHGLEAPDADGEEGPDRPRTPSHLRPPTAGRAHSESGSDSSLPQSRSVEFELPSPVSPSRPRSPWALFDPYNNNEVKPVQKERREERRTYLALLSFGWMLFIQLSHSGAEVQNKDVPVVRRLDGSLVFTVEPDSSFAFYYRLVEFILNQILWNFRIILSVFMQFLKNNNNKTRSHVNLKGLLICVYF